MHRVSAYLSGLLLVCLFGSGCRVVGDKSLSILSPEEKELIETHRRMKAAPKTREIEKRPEPRNKEEAVRELSHLAHRLRAEAREIREEREKERSWDFKWSWDRGVATPGAPGDDHPDYDEDGNLIVNPEIVRTYQIPDIHAGAIWDITEDKLRSVMEVEIFELKVPVLRHLPVGIVAGEQYLGGHISKRWTSVFEVETGLFWGRDFDTDTNTVGVGALIIKF